MVTEDDRRTEVELTHLTIFEPFGSDQAVSTTVAMIDKQDIVDYVDETYSYGITTYDHGSFVRVSNGSAAHKADIRLSDSRLEVKAERYGETHRDDYEPTLDGLKAALHDGLGL